MSIITSIVEIFQTSGFAALSWQNWVMIAVAFVLLYLAIVKKFEPLLLLPIAFGMLLVNVYPEIMYDPLSIATPGGEVLDASAHWYDSGVLRLIYCGVKSSIFPCLIFMGVGAMTDFGPLLANPSSLLLGAAAQLGIYVAFLIAIVIPEFRIGNFVFDGFTAQEAASIAIIGGADGPTAIYLTGKLASHLLGPIAVAAYSYMALIPLIQPPIMKLLTTKKERAMHMPYNPKHVSRSLRICFPIMVTIIAGFIAPMSVSLVGFLMFGNLLRECGCLERLSQTAQNDLANLITLLLGITISFSMQADQFVNLKTLIIMALGLVAFVFDSIAGVMFAKLLNLFCKNKVNPMVGAAGISAFPMSARVIQKMGQEADCTNHLLMHAVGANVAGQIASVLAGGMILNLVPQLLG